MVILLSRSAGLLSAAASPQEHQFAVKGIVVDSMGAVVSQAEVEFKGDHGRVVAHTGMDGSVSVNLKAANYVVTVSAPGFATTKLNDFSVPSPTADAFRVTLNVDPRTELRSDRYHDDIGVPTVLSELPNSINDEPTPTPLPVTPAATTKRRSVRCLYLWRCSASRP